MDFDPSIVILGKIYEMIEDIMFTEVFINRGILPTFNKN